MTTKPSTLAKPRIDAALTFAQGPRAARDDRRVFNAPPGHRRLTLNLPEELHKGLRQAALDEDCTVTEIVLRLVRGRLGL